MKKISILFLGMLLAGLAFSQEEQEKLRTTYPDTIVLETDTKDEIIFVFKRLSDRKEYLRQSLWQSMLGIMETAVNRNDLKEGIRVTYETVKREEGEEVIVEVKEIPELSSIFYIRKDETNEYPASRIEFLILQPEVAISFRLLSLEQLEQLKSLDITSVWDQIKDKYTNEGKVNLYRGEGTIKYNEAYIERITAEKPRLDQLEITLLGIGLGYYRDQFVPDLGSKLSIHMYDRLGNDWMEYGVLYTRQYFFSRNESNDYDLDANGFLTGFWKIKTASEGEFGVGIGGLIHRQGDFYEGSTWKLSLYSQGANAAVTFSPEIIFTNDFKDVFPALRFGLSF